MIEISLRQREGKSRAIGTGADLAPYVRLINRLVDLMLNHLRPSSHFVSH